MSKMKGVILVAQPGLLLFSTTSDQIKHLSARIFFFLLLPVKWVNDLFAVNPAVQWEIFDEHFYILMNTPKTQELCKKKTKERRIWSVKTPMVIYQFRHGNLSSGDGDDGTWWHQCTKLPPLHFVRHHTAHHQAFHPHFHWDMTFPTVIFDLLVILYTFFCNRSNILGIKVQDTAISCQTAYY